MSYKALLFCPDEKTARVVTQVLNDLEIRVEPCNEPFTAVKKLMAEHYDAIVVDCDNEQNATLLFKSAHNSGSNQASLAVAVVEGQSGVAKAFRIGANLVLTKPINVEQSKGTLRVARGLLRKSEAAKPAGTASAMNSSPRSMIADRPAPSDAGALKPRPATLPVQPPPSPIPTVNASVFDVEQEPAPKPEAAEAAFLESIPDLESKTLATEPAPPAATKEYPWQPVSKPMAGTMATALRHAAEAAGKVETPTISKTPPSPAAISDAAMGRSFSTSATSGHGAAAAPAREPVKAEKPLEMREPEPPAFSSLTAEADSPSGGSKKFILIAAVVVATAAAGYIGWTKTHPAGGTVVPQKPAAIVQPAPLQPQPQPEATVTPSASQTQEIAHAASSSQPASPLPVEPRSVIATSASTSPAPAPRKTTSIIASDTVTRNPEAEADAPVPMVVKSQVSKPAPPAPAAQEPAQPPALSLLGDASTSNQAISGIVNSPAVTLPRPAQTVKVSQGVSQGLLVKNVQPAYPALARQMRVQGAVELLASISKDGDITAVKVISGDSVLARAAMDAVKQWKYKPYYLDGQPVEIQTQITVKFKLP